MDPNHNNTTKTAVIKSAVAYVSISASFSDSPLSTGSQMSSRHQPQYQEEVSTPANIILHESVTNSHNLVSRSDETLASSKPQRSAKPTIPAAAVLASSPVRSVHHKVTALARQNCSVKTPPPVPERKCAQLTKPVPGNSRSGNEVEGIYANYDDIARATVRSSFDIYNI